jgi:hypothetical protein
VTPATINAEAFAADTVGFRTSGLVVLPVGAPQIQDGQGRGQRQANGPGSTITSDGEPP